MATRTEFLGGTTADLVKEEREQQCPQINCVSILSIVSLNTFLGRSEWLSWLKERLVRYETWRLRQPVHRPMLGVLWEPDVPPLEGLIDLSENGQPITPESIHPERCFASVDRWYHHHAQLAGDLIQRFTPSFGIPWIEAIAGCPVMAGPGSLWAKPCLEGYIDRPNIRLHPDNPWLAKLVEFTRAMVQFSDGRFLIAPPQLRGPLDTLAAMLTPQQMCTDILDQPKAVRQILGELADLWIAVGDAVLKEIPSHGGGYMARMGTWAPGPAITPQNDCSTLISADTYRELVLPWDQNIVEHFPFTEFHLHGSEFHQIPNLLSLENLDVIQLTLEHTLGGPPLDKMLPLTKEILAQKPLILACLDVPSAQQCLEELPPEGLMLTIATAEQEIPSEIPSWLASHRP